MEPVSEMVTSSAPKSVFAWDRLTVNSTAEPSTTGLGPGEMVNVGGVSGGGVGAARTGPTGSDTSVFTLPRSSV